MTAPCRVLFVDDEPELLNGLAKALRKQRGKWDMVFAIGPEAALEQLARARFDVVVSDMRMPQLDGAQLLARVRDIDPAVFRIILSGYSDRDSLLRSLAVAHQFFDKPCNLADLRSAIDRAHELHALFDDEAIRTVLARLGTIPPLPAAYHELAALVAQPDASLAAIDAVLERDAALYDQVRRLGTVELQTACGLALAAHVFGAFGAGPTSLPLQTRALAIAERARALAGEELAADAFTAGAVLDLGELVIACALPEAHASIEARSAGSRQDRIAIEREVIGTTHAEIGASLLGMWNLPLAIVGAVASHAAGPGTTPLTAALYAAQMAD